MITRTMISSAKHIDRDPIIINGLPKGIIKGVSFDEPAILSGYGQDIAQSIIGQVMSRAGKVIGDYFITSYGNGRADLGIEFY